MRAGLDHVTAAQRLALHADVARQAQAQAIHARKLRTAVQWLSARGRLLAGLRVPPDEQLPDVPAFLRRQAY